MTSITIRRLPQATKERLRQRAQQSGLSLESYTRQILQQATEGGSTECRNLVDLAQSCFGTAHGIDLQLPARGSNRPVISFE
jgi:plasmid stability protein